MNHYIISDQSGNQAVDGGRDLALARKQAQSLADRWHGPAYLRANGADEDDFESFEPGGLRSNKAGWGVAV